MRAKIFLYQVLLRTNNILYALLIFVLLGVFTVFIEDVDYYKSFFSKYSRKKTLFCFILASPENFFHKTTTIQNTWAKQCDVRFSNVLIYLFIYFIPFFNKLYSPY